MFISLAFRGFLRTVRSNPLLTSRGENLNRVRLFGLAVIAVVAAAAQATGAGSAPSTTSSSGETIAFASLRGGDLEIYSMNAGGTDQTRLTMHSSSDLDPAWSPDGGKIAFASNRVGEFELYVMSMAVSNL